MDTTDVPRNGPNGYALRYGPCREPPCWRVAEQPDGMCHSHSVSRRAGFGRHVPGATDGPPCIIPGCPKTFRHRKGCAFGMCVSHYAKLRRLRPEPWLRELAAGRIRWLLGAGEDADT